MYLQIGSSWALQENVKNVIFHIEESERERERERDDSYPLIT
jgi:hypothetical protein